MRRDDVLGSWAGRTRKFGRREKKVGLIGQLLGMLESLGLHVSKYLTLYLGRCDSCIEQRLSDSFQDSNSIFDMKSPLDS